MRERGERMAGDPVGTNIKVLGWIALILCRLVSCHALSANRPVSAMMETGRRFALSHLKPQPYGRHR